MNIKRFVNAFKQLPNVYKLSPKDRWARSAEFLSPHLVSAVCNYHMIFVSGITLQLERQQAQGQRRERLIKKKQMRKPWEWYLSCWALKCMWPLPNIAVIVHGILTASKYYVGKQPLHFENILEFPLLSFKNEVYRYLSLPFKHFKKSIDIPV